MSKQTIHSAPGSSQEDETDITAGEILRRARKSAGVEIPTLSSALKVSEKRIEALEDNRFDLLPNPVFYRSLAASICKHLQIDAAPVLEKLPKTTAPQFNGGMSGINQPFRARGETWHVTIPSFLTKPTTWIVLALLVASLIILLLPEQKAASISQLLHKSPAITTQSDDVPNEAVSQPAMVTVAPSAMSLPAEPEKILPPVAAVASKPASTPASAASVAARPASAAVAASASSTPLPPIAAVVNGLIRFKAKGSVWIQVVDANGKTQLSKALSAGEVIAASGATPLAVTVGRADLVDVEVRGAPFNVMPFAKENIAKFEVK